MPKFGLKCFLGSFIFSLAAVFAATRVYLALSQEQEENDLYIVEAEPKDIELFANNEENDALYEKHAVLSQPEKFESAVSSEELTTDILPQKEASLQTASAENDILYMPDGDNTEESKVLADIQGDLPESDFSDIVSDAIAEDILLAQEEDLDDELQIADAADAVEFIIPLVHNYKTDNKNVSVSSQTEAHQIAFASQNVSIHNLNPETQTPAADSPIADTANNVSAETIDSPWAVAEASNKHITKNKIEAFNNEHRNEVAALDKSKQEAAQSDSEIQVAYKMIKNQVIPIPDEIMNDENLTPKLAYSEENKKLEQSLLDKKPKSSPQPPVVEKKKEVEEEITKMPQSDDKKSLTDSIAAWFSGSAKKGEQDNVPAPKAPNDGNNEKSSSSFRKLLGLNGNSKDNIAPTELKLFFQPDRAEISGQTLEWLHAFSENVVNNENVIIEIRIDGASSYELQQKRLNLLYTILANNGVNYNKINIIFTDREPNSFIIRNVRYATEEELLKATRKGDNPWY